MKLTSSYAIEIKHVNKMFRNTIKIYNDAISFCIKAFEEHWKVLETLETGNKERFAYADALIHSTKSNLAAYPEFDTQFHKISSYLRFSIINTALGYLSSYHSNLVNWEISNTDNKAPTLQIHLNKLPTFYKGNMYIDDCDAIVFEHLDMKGKKKGSKKQKLQMWKKNTIQKIATHKAHKNGIRVSHICAWGTSKLAFDGSSKVLRGKETDLDTYELCRFSNGKIYNCDLSASYNIRARYFIQEIQKILPAKVWSDIVAKAPECQKRTQCTYNALLEINRVA